MDCLRDFLRRELSGKTTDIPLSFLVAKCYKEFLLRANNGLKGKIPAARLQEKLRQIALEILKESDG